MGQRRGRHAVSPCPAQTGPRSRPKLSHLLLALLSATVFLATGVSWATVDLVERDVNTADALDPAVVDESPAGSDGALDLLLVGTDSRTNAQGEPLPLPVLRKLRTEYSVGTSPDTIILVRVPNDGTAAHVVSIPRDTLVTPSGGQPSRISSVYQRRQSDVAEQLRGRGASEQEQITRESTQAARRALVQAVQELTGVGIDHYAEVSLLGFAVITEALGGVQVCLNAAVNDPGSGAHFPAGWQTVTGGDALSFVRQRDGLPRGDLDRIVRQQVFLGSLVNRILSAGTLTDPQRVAELMSAVRRSVVLDKSWNPLGFAQQMQNLTASSVKFVTIPVLDTTLDEHGQHIVTVDPAQVRTFIAGLVDSPMPNSPPGPPAPASAATQAAAHRPIVDVFNGAGTDGLARQLADRLSAAGFTTGEIGNTSPREHTVINVAPGQDPIGEQVSGLLGGGIPVQPDPELKNNHIVVLLGRDYPARPGDRLTGPALLRLEGAIFPVASHRTHRTHRTQPVPSPSPPIRADGVPCVN